MGGDAGVISCDGFQSALAAVGVSTPDSKALFDVLDSDGDGELAYSDFLAAASTSHLDLDEHTLPLYLARLMLMVAGCSLQRTFAPRWEPCSESGARRI